MLIFFFKFNGRGGLRHQVHKIDICNLDLQPDFDNQLNRTTN